MSLFTFQNLQGFLLKSILLQFFSYIFLDLLFIICYNLDINLFIHFFLNYHIMCFVLVNLLSYRFLLVKYCGSLEVILYHRLNLINIFIFYYLVPLFFNLLVFNFLYVYILYKYFSVFIIG